MSAAARYFDAEAIRAAGAEAVKDFPPIPAPVAAKVAALLALPVPQDVPGAVPPVTVPGTQVAS